MKIVTAGEDQDIAKAKLCKCKKYVEQRRTSELISLHASSAIEDLDLSKNLVNDWLTVAKIVAQLSQLKILRLK